jgi:hypothetical protein
MTLVTRIVASAGILPRAGIAPGARAQNARGPPAAPALAAPADGTVVQDAWGGVVLEWNGVPGAVDYQVVINDGERTGPWLSETSWSPGTLPEGEYRWAVRARNGAGSGETAADFKFMIAPSGGNTGDASAPRAPVTFSLQQPAIPLDAAPDVAAVDTPLLVGDDGQAQQLDGETPANEDAPAPAATPAAGTPVPVEGVLAEPDVETATRADAPADDTGGNRGADGADGADGKPGKNGQDGQPGADATNIDVSGTDSGQNDRKRERREERDRKAEERERPKRNPNNGNGGVSEVIAEPLYYQNPVNLEQQDASDASAGSVGESGTINGRPRESSDPAPAETTGPGNPMAPGGVILPPSVPGGYDVTSPNVNPNIAGGIGSTAELAFDAVADTTVFTAAPDAPQSPESAATLAIGGPQGAVTLMSFDVSGVGEGTVLSALLSFTGGGDARGPGGGVGVIHGYVVPDGLTANQAPSAETALNVHGAPAWFEEVEPGGTTAVDVTGSVSGDGTITFVLPGQPDGTGYILASESGAVPQLVLTVAQPA